MSKTLLLASALVLAPLTALAQVDDTTADPSTDYGTEVGPTEPTPPEPAPTPTADASAGATATATAPGAANPKGAGSLGLQFTLPSGGGAAAGITYFLSPSAALRVDLGVLFRNFEVPPDDRDTVGGFSLEVGYRMYMGMAGKVHPYIQPGLFLLKVPGVEFGDALALAVTGGFGAEYMFTDQFAVGGQTGLALSFRNSFKDIALNTGTSALYAAWYW